MTSTKCSALTNVESVISAKLIADFPKGISVYPNPPFPQPQAKRSGILWASPPRPLRVIANEVSKTLWASPPHALRTSASEAMRNPYCRFASLRGTKQIEDSTELIQTCGFRKEVSLHAWLVTSRLVCFVVPPRNDGAVAAFFVFVFVLVFGPCGSRERSFDFHDAKIRTLFQIADN